MRNNTNKQTKQQAKKQNKASSVVWCSAVLCKNLNISYITGPSWLLHSVFCLKFAYQFVLMVCTLITVQIYHLKSKSEQEIITKEKKGACIKYDAIFGIIWKICNCRLTIAYWREIYVTTSIPQWLDVVFSVFMKQEKTVKLKSISQ